jgi:hypothetical protein
VRPVSGFLKVQYPVHNVDLVRMERDMYMAKGRTDIAQHRNRGSTKRWKSMRVFYTQKLKPTTKGETDV